MNGDNRILGNPPNRQFWNCACSGATCQDILDHQFLDLSARDSIYGNQPMFGNLQIATLTAGGDDVESPNLDRYCIYQLSVSKPCDGQIAKSRAVLEGDKWKNSLDAVIKTAFARGQKAAGLGFKLFVTGYAGFFSNETADCDHVTFSVFKPAHFSFKLTLRTTLNTLTTDLKSRILSIVAANVGVE